MYRARLELIDPDACRHLDEALTGWGETWVAPRVVTFDLEDWLTPSQAADLVSSSAANIRRLRLAGRLTGRFRNGRWQYQAKEVMRIISEKRSRKSIDKDGA